ncbi:hypothetical protein [Ramlibacter sp. AN1133]|uniref:hypothetical protein n=1 Tax=Ramlibacter sp. AN1133 TaxID=3133429 RepID=UPI0030C4492D
MATDPEVLRIANDSGFPLQIAVQQSVTAEEDRHGWRVVHTEHGWHNPADCQSGFIDLVLRDRNDFANIVVECKRVRNATWLFFNTAGTSNPRRHCKAWVSYYRDGQFRAFGWHDVPIDPPSPEAKFCAVRGQTTNDKNTYLERVAGELISSTEALALEERDYRRENDEDMRMYFNVVVTTAELKVASFDVTHLSVADGTLKEAEVVDVPFVRVRKQFSMRPANLTPADWLRHDDPDYRRENTVIVVRADKLNDFLQGFDIPNASIRRLGV